jgi:uncharacterized protein (TIGR03067 family)
VEVKTMLKSMCWIATLVLTGILVYGADARTAPARAGSVDEAIKKELRALEGTWRIKKCEVNGTEIPAEAIESARWTMKGDEIQVTDDFSEEPTVLKLVVSPAESPKHFDTTMTSIGKNKKVVGELPDDLKGKTIPGIYTREGDTLTVCQRDVERLDDGRPKDFEARKGVVRIVLERVKAK